MGRKQRASSAGELEIERAKVKRPERRLRNALIGADGLSRAPSFRFFHFAIFVVDVDGEGGEGSAVWGRVGRVPAFDLTPEDAVQPLCWRCVRDGEIHLRRIDSSLAGFAVEGADFWVGFEEVVGCFDRSEWREIGFVGEAGPHVVGDQIEDRHRGEAEDQLHRLQHTLVGIKGRIDLALADIRAGDKSCGAVPVHVVDSVLSIVFDDEDCHFRPEF